jgi:hypothetical protein
MGETRNALKILVGKGYGTRRLGISKRRSEEDGRWEQVYWMHISQDTDQWCAVLDTLKKRQVS